MNILIRALRKAVLPIYKQYREARKKETTIALYRSVRRDVHNCLKKLPQPELSAAEKQEIIDFWSQFGFDIKDFSWFQWYYGITGIKDPRFIPQEYYYYLILPHYNRKMFIAAYKDKNSFDFRLPKDYLPNTVLKRINGDFYDNSGVFLTSDSNSEQLIDVILAHKQVIVKNALDSGCGKNVQKYEIGSREDVLALLQEWDVSDYIIQEVIQQHPFFAQFNESSVNIIRINSWFHEGEVTLSTPVLRFGMPGHPTDVCFIDGEEIINLVGVTPDGMLRDSVVQMSGKKQPIEDYCGNSDRKVPAWDELISMVRENSKLLHHFHLIGWDVTVTSDGRPITIEYNIGWPGSVPSQMVNGPMWGEHTQELLSFLKDDLSWREYYLK